MAQHLGLSHLAGVADLEGAAWAAGAHGLLVGEPLDGRGGQGGALLDGAVHPVGVGHGEEGGVDALGGGLDVGEPHPVVVAAESALVSSGKDGLVHHVQGLAVVDHPVGGCVHGEDAASPADGDLAFQEVGDLVRHHFHGDHSLLSSLCLDGERSGGAGVAGCWLLDDDLVVLREDHDVLGVVLLLGQDGVRVPLGAVSSDHVVAVVQLVAGGIRCLSDKKGGGKDSLVGLLVEGVHVSTLEDALAIEALAKNCPVDLLDQVAEEESLVSGEVKSNLRGVVQGEDLPDPGRQPDVLEDGGVQGGGDLQVERLQPLVELDDHLDAVHVTVVDVGQLVDVFDEQTLEDGVKVSSDGEHFHREVRGSGDLDLDLYGKD